MEQGGLSFARLGLCEDAIVRYPCDFFSPYFRRSNQGLGDGFRDDFIESQFHPKRFAKFSPSMARNSFSVISTESIKVSKKVLKSGFF